MGSGEFGLSQNCPDPFNRTANFELRDSNAGPERLTIFDRLGCEVATVLEKELQAGYYDLSWNASAVSSGICIARLHSGIRSATRKLMLLKQE